MGGMWTERLGANCHITKCGGRSESSEPQSSETPKEIARVVGKHVVGVGRKVSINVSNRIVATPVKFIPLFRVYVNITI